MPAGFYAQIESLMMCFLTAGKSDIIDGIAALSGINIWI
jgi:hypothetical protein